MKGFYVYCIRPKLANAYPTKAKGVEFAKNVKVFSFKDIEAVVGELDLSKFDGEKIKEKLLDDPKWAEENIRRHHGVIDRAFRTGVVIPMKFGTIYKGEKNLIVSLAKYYRKFKNLISRLQDRKEWGVKMYLDHKKFMEGLKKKSKEVRKFEKRRPSMPEGMRWYAERKIDEIILDESEEEIEKELQYFVEKLEKHVEKVRLGEAFSKDIRSPAGEMILNAACLVRNDRLSEFQSLLREIAKECDTAGITLKLSGPWPPYNFVD